MFTKTITFTLSFVVLIAAQRRRRYTAVTPLDGAEQFYLKLRHSRTPCRPSANETLKVKQAICLDITGSPLFDAVYGVEPADPVDIELTRYYQTSFKNMVTSTAEYRQLEVNVDGELFLEYGFSCLTRSRRNKLKKALDTKEYFVSAEYQLNEAAQNDETRRRRPPDERNASFARFVFAYRTKSQGVIVALAEEPGRTVNLKVAMPLYTADDRIRTDTEFAEDEMADTICDLPAFLKVRLCTVVLSAKEYSEEVRFVPRRGDVDPQCVRKGIAFNGAKDERTPADWMIGCKATKVRANRTRTYYVSRGFSAHNYFICGTSECGDAYLCIAGVSHRIAAKAFLHERYFSAANRTT